MKYSEIVKNIDDIFDYFKFHNKNLTKTQFDKILELQDLVHDLKITEKKQTK